MNHALIAANIVVFMVMALIERSRPDLFARVQETLWLNPRQITAWGLVSYAFLHAGLMHILGNMLFLWVFGPSVEDRLGRVWYLVFYLAGGAAAGGLHAAFERAPVVGASGAVAAVTGMYLVLFPRTHIRTLVIFFIIGVFMIPAWWYIGARIAWDLVLQARGSGRVATLAHLGGYGLGIGLGLVLLRTGLLAREPWDLVSIWRQSSRRRELRDAVRSAEQERARTFQKAKRDEAASEALAEARSLVARAVASEEWEEAARAYETLLSTHDDRLGACVLSRRHQYDLANYLYGTDRLGLAASAYDGLLRAYPDDAEAPAIKLLLATILGRRLGKHAEAKRLLNEAIEELDEGEAIAMAREELTWLDGEAR